MGDFAQESGEYLSALCNLRTLKLDDTRLEDMDEGVFRTCFSAFRDTLTHLSLDNIVMSFSAFATLIGYFPNVTTLQLHLFMLEPDEGPVPPLSRPLRGKLQLHVCEVQADSLELFNRFAQSDLEYEELVIDHFSTIPGTKFLESALRVSPSTIKLLRFAAELDRM